MVSRDNIIIGAIVTISITFIGALLNNVFSPVSEELKDIISPPPDTTVNKTMVFDTSNQNLHKMVLNNTVIPGRAVTFYFSSHTSPEYHYFLGIRYPFPTNKISTFECSMDGAPFADCISPKTYTDLTS